MSNYNSRDKKPDPTGQSGAKEREDDIFDDTPAQSTQNIDKAKGTKDKDGWETIPLHGGNNDQRSKK
ncbi:hypothetical protein F5Y12DRAFT_720990 [Xylaria sp. FL1777]|nr:hypothetical protein F5Y12DRAFT_720990 [Xylaria sp. FL1777]